MRKLLCVVVLFLGYQAKAAGCLGHEKLRCGPSISLFEIKPASANPAFLALGPGYMLEYGFQKWTFGIAATEQGSYAIGSTKTFLETKLSTFGCLGKPFGYFSGICGGPDFAMLGPNGLLQGRFTWHDSFGIVLNINPDLITGLVVGQ